MCLERKFVLNTGFFVVVGVSVEQVGDLRILLAMEEKSSDGTASRSCEPW